MWISLRGQIATGILAALLAVTTAVTWTNGSDAAVVPTATDGQSLFHTEGCVGCHAIITSVSGSIGPSLADLSQRAPTRVKGMTAADYIRQSIQEPEAFTVPGYGSGVMPLCHSRKQRSTY